MHRNEHTGWPPSEVASGQSCIAVGTGCQLPMVKWQCGLGAMECMEQGEWWTWGMDTYVAALGARMTRPITVWVERGSDKGMEGGGSGP